MAREGPISGSEASGVFQRELGRVSVVDFNASFRGEIYGEGGVDADWFAEHVGRHGIDLARSPRWIVDGALGGMALLAFRGERAWIGAFGVVPGLRGRGFARRFVADALAVAAESGATSVELEVLERNPAAIALYERCGFSPTGKLVVWKRAPFAASEAVLADDIIGGRTRDGDGARACDGDHARDYDVAAVARIARRPATCWQREPLSVAAAAPFAAILIGPAGAPDGYAFVRHAGGRTAVLDAGARDAQAAAAVLAALDASAPAAEPMLINEPPHGALHDALAAHPAWSELTRQRRMIVRLRP